MSSTDHICESEKIPAFIDGDLEPAARAAFEEHITQCSHCNSELQALRQFVCELDSALASPFDLPVPLNFAEVVAVRAESDMRGVRDGAEHAKALRFCLMLSLAAFALLGVTATQAGISNAQSLAGQAFGILGLFGKTIYDAAVGFSVITRVLSGGLTTNSRLAGLTALLVALAIGLLSILISRYHRARLTE
jgi:predicted anti-sigma-YlaC factor YlaD